jgi:hypothetical protein
VVTLHETVLQFIVSCMPCISVLTIDRL